MAKQVKVIIEKDRKYLLVKRADEEKKEHKGNWECPGGKLNENESFEDAAIRESKEETNLDIRLVKRVKELGKDGQIDAVVFLAKPKSTSIKISNEHSDFRWFTYDELKNLEPVTYKDFFMQLIDLTRS